jgi:hypothetical protein
LTDKSNQTRSTKITTPISFPDPTKYIADTRSEVLEKGARRNANRNLTDVAKPSLSTAHAYALSFFANALVSQSAQRIYLVDLGYLTEQVMSGLPDLLKPRIVWADRDRKIMKSTTEMLDPIFAEIEPLWEKIRNRTGVEDTKINGHEHGLCIINEFLVTIAVAVKYQTEADIDLRLVCGAIDRLRPQIKSDESLAVLSRIEGVLNCYQISGRIPGLRPKTQPVPSDLLRDLLDDARVISLSKSRFLLGIPGRFEIAMIRMRQKLRDILSDRTNREHLATASKIGNIATKFYNIEIPEIESEATRGFTPPLISLQKTKAPCISTIRKLPTVKPPNAG